MTCGREASADDDAVTVTRAQVATDHNASPDLVALSRGVIEKGSTSFATAAKLFAPETRASCYLLYAWCRHCDDMIDGQDLGFTQSAVRPDARAALARLQSETAAALDGKAVDEPVFKAFQAVALKHAIARRHPFDHLEGFRMDVDGDPYRTIEDTLRYCYHVAGVVGVMMARIMGADTPQALDRASDLGIAFQLTNIARDIVPDAVEGRVYLPDAWLAEAGLPVGPLAAAGISDRANRAQVFTVAQRLVALAEGYYRSAYVGLGALPIRSAWAVGTARSVYRRIGREVVGRGPAAWDGRVSTTRSQKLGAVASGVAQALATRITPKDVQRTGLFDRPT